MYANNPFAIPALRVLVVEDGLTNRQLAIRLLESLGHVVTAVTNGVQAVEALQQSIFDVVLMDIDMPEMDGLSATRHIRSSETHTGSHVPIVAVTSNDNRDECLRAGMDAYLPKPLRTKAVEQTLGDLLPTRVG